MFDNYACDRLSDLKDGEAVQIQLIIKFIKTLNRQAQNGYFQGIERANNQHLALIDCPLKTNK
jgi:hypothetical protein